MCTGLPGWLGPVPWRSQLQLDWPQELKRKGPVQPAGILELIGVHKDLSRERLHQQHLARATTSHHGEGGGGNCLHLPVRAATRCSPGCMVGSRAPHLGHPGAV